MDIKFLQNDAKSTDLIRQFVRNPSFLIIKDAFVAHTPGGDDCSDSSIHVAHGKNLGTRFVFNEMERIAALLPDKKEKPKNYTQDPDLES